MQKVVIEKPYRFLPPHRGTLLPWLIRAFRLHQIYLRQEGIVDYECRGVSHLRQSLAAGHGIILTPNHTRNPDPITLGWLCCEAPCFVYGMASWHLFHHHWFTSLAIRVMGGFSVNREGVDRQSVNMAIDVVAAAERPLILFPEGASTRTNDHLHALLDGVALIARGAARRRKKSVDGKVVVHPVAIKYLFGGDVREAVAPVLDDLERRLDWTPRSDRPLLKRIEMIALAHLRRLEKKYFGETMRGALAARRDALLERLLCPLEESWLGGTQTGPVVPRVKLLRTKIVPDLAEGRIADDQERARRWRDLDDIYIAQQLSCYLPGYVEEYPSVDRILETVERLEEDITGKCRIHGRLKVIVEVGPAIEVSPKRGEKGEGDSLMEQIGERLREMLARLAKESPLYKEPLGPSKD